MGSNMDEDAIYETYEVNKADKRKLKSVGGEISRNNKKEMKIKEKKPNLVLWDIENINFYDDYKIVGNYVDDLNSLKYVVGKEIEKYSNISRLSKEGFYPRLKRRGWNIDKKPKKVDERIMNYYYKHKSHIEKLILITDDSDFKPIVVDAVKNGIEVLILYRDKRNVWVKSYDSIKLENKK